MAADIHNSHRHLHSTAHTFVETPVRRIDCTNPIFEMTAAPCPAGIVKATLSRAWCPQYDLTVSPIVNGQFTVGPIPTDIKPGVWRLSFDTDCGCFMASVNVDLCQAPGFTATHTATPDTETSTECCPTP